MNLDEIRFATPCRVPWETMEPTADERVRFCGQCRRNVYHVSMMSRAEAETFIEATDGRECVQLWKRDDGTVVTADCPSPKPPHPIPLGGAPLPPPPLPR